MLVYLAIDLGGRNRRSMGGSDVGPLAAGLASGPSAPLVACHPVAERPEARFDIANGRTLCVERHAKSEPEYAHPIRKAKHHAVSPQGSTQNG